VGEDKMSHSSHSSHASHASHESHESHSSHSSHGSHSSHASHASHGSHGSHSSHASHASHSSHVSHSSHSNSISTTEYTDSQAISAFPDTRASIIATATSFNDLVTKANKLRSLASGSSLSASVSKDASIQDTDLPNLNTTFYEVPSFKDAKVQNDTYTSQYFRKWYPISGGFYSTSPTATTITEAGTSTSADSTGSYTTTTATGTEVGSLPAGTISEGSPVGYPTYSTSYSAQLKNIRNIYKVFGKKHSDSI
jgi:hypothetical protein